MASHCGRNSPLPVRLNAPRIMVVNEALMNRAVILGISAWLLSRRYRRPYPKWNELIHAHSIALLCSYSLDLLQPHDATGWPKRLLDAHTHVLTA